MHDVVYKFARAARMRRNSQRKRPQIIDFISILIMCCINDSNQKF